MGVPKVKTKISLSFVDHNMLQYDFRNADNHCYLQGVKAKCGIVFSRPGSGICHQLYVERFARVYLVSPETAVASAITGEITDPRKLGKYPKISLPEKIVLSDNMFIYSTTKATSRVAMGPNIKPLPSFKLTPDRLTGEVLLKLDDNVSTDDILPEGTEIMSLRSNIPEISKIHFLPR